MTEGQQVLDPDPELINAQSFDIAKHISPYGATSMYIHVHIPFNFTMVFQSKIVL
jgi:hypothetical protein